MSLSAAAGPPSAVRALMHLVGARRPQDIGFTGPPVAATVGFAGDAYVDEHFRKFEAVFGRDSLVAASFLLDRYPALAEATVVALAERQGAVLSEKREEEPGRIPHEIRDSSDPVAIKLGQELRWEWPYYGSVDATCLWLTVVARLARRDPGFLRRRVTRADGREVDMLACSFAALDWLVRRLGSSRHGLLESAPKFEGSLEHQVWKDRWDSYSHRDGSLPRVGNIASVEAQGLAYDAAMNGLFISREAQRLGSAVPGWAPDEATLRECATTLRTTVLQRFWVERDGRGFFAIAVEQDDAGALRRLEVRASNMGHLLNTGILEGGGATARQRSMLVSSLFEQEMLCAAGIRTLASDEVRYRPGSYHNGSSWPWDTSWVADGLDRSGYPQLAAELRRRVLSVYLSCRGFPEFVRGDAKPPPRENSRIVEIRDPSGRLNRLEQPPQQLQAWTVAAILSIKLRNGRGSVSTQRDSADLALEQAVLAGLRR